jgi:hypothetical protein
MRERFLSEWERQQIVEVTARDAAPAKMLRHQCRLDARDEFHQLVEVRVGERIDRAERQSDSVQREGIVGANPLECSQRRSTVGEIVLAVDLEPPDPRPRGCDVPDVGRAQADARNRWKARVGRDRHTNGRPGG